MKGKVFLIAGFDINQTAAHKDYQDLRQAIKDKNYEVIPVDIYWRKQTMSGFVKKFIKFYQHKKGAINIIIGNSFGAEVALITAPKLKPDKIILCSLSPFFKEDIPRFNDRKKLEKWFGPRRLKDLEQISANEAAKRINQTNIKTIMFYGEKEKIMYKKLVERVKATAKDINETELMEITEAAHSFKDPAYIKVISESL